MFNSEAFIRSRAIITISGISLTRKGTLFNQFRINVCTFNETPMIESPKNMNESGNPFMRVGN